MLPRGATAMFDQNSAFEETHLPAQVGEDGATVVKPSSRHASENLAARSLSHVELPSLLDDHAHHRRRGIFTPRLHPWEDRERKKTDVEVSSFLLGIKARAGNDPRTRETSFLAMGARLELNNSMEMKLSLNPASPRRGSTLTRTDNNSGDALQAYQNYQVCPMLLDVIANFI